MLVQDKYFQMVSGIWNPDSRWLQKKHTPGQLNHGQAQVQHPLLLTPSQALV